jgi:hypothetical protein
MKKGKKKNTHLRYKLLTYVVEFKTDPIIFNIDDCFGRIMQVVGISARFEFGCNSLFPVDNTLFSVGPPKAARPTYSFNSPGFAKYNLTWVSDIWSTWVEDLISEHDKIYKAATCGEYPRTYLLVGLLMDCQGARVRKLSILCPSLLHFSRLQVPLLITGMSSKIRGGYENSSLNFIHISRMPSTFPLDSVHELFGYDWW